MKQLGYNLTVKSTVFCMISSGRSPRAVVLLVQSWRFIAVSNLKLLNLHLFTIIIAVQRIRPLFSFKLLNFQNRIAAIKEMI